MVGDRVSQLAVYQDQVQGLNGEVALQKELVASLRAEKEELEELLHSFPTRQALYVFLVLALGLGLTAPAVRVLLHVAHEWPVWQGRERVVIM